LRREISRLADENMAQQQERDALHKQHDELVGRFAQAQSKLADAVKRICAGAPAFLETEQ
jgi:predicted  nucleic acid-binding Zn-ribbon protein